MPQHWTMGVYITFTIGVLLCIYAVLMAVRINRNRPIVSRESGHTYRVRRDVRHRRPRKENKVNGG